MVEENNPNSYEKTQHRHPNCRFYVEISLGSCAMCVLCVKLQGTYLLVVLRVVSCIVKLKHARISARRRKRISFECVWLNRLEVLVDSAIGCKTLVICVKFGSLEKEEQERRKEATIGKHKVDP